MKISSKHRKLIKEFCNSQNLRVKFDFKTSFAREEECLMCLSNDFQSIEDIWSCVFHELCHIFCYWEGLFFKYHHTDNEDYWKREGLKAEIRVDKMAEKLMSIYLPDLKFVPCYRTKEDQHQKFLIRHNL